MSTWDMRIFDDEANQDFLADLAELEEEDVVKAVYDACRLAVADRASEEEILNGQAAATLAAIWRGAPFSAGDVADDYPFIRDLIGSGSEELSEVAAEILEDVSSDEDVDLFLESLA